MRSSIGKDKTNDARVVIMSFCAGFSDSMLGAFGGP